MASRINQSHLIDCRFAAHDKDSNFSDLVFTDISAKHFNTDMPLPPERECYESIMKCRAERHAAWREHPDLQKYTGRFLTKKELAAEAISFRPMTEKFCTFPGGRVTSALQGIMNAFPRIDLEAFFDRFASGKSITLIRLDNHPWNYMFPKEKDTSI